jgi:hypothetical protein
VSTYVVAFNPDLTLIVEAVGPFRSLTVAEAACETLIEEIDSHDMDDPAVAARLPQVVRLITLRDAVARYGTTPGEAQR